MATHRTRRRAFWMMSVAPIVLFAAGSARAQDRPAASKAKSEVTTVEVITVTANKREESLQDVAASISAVSGTAIEQQRIQTYDDLQNAVAGVAVNGESDRQYINMRGTYTQLNDAPGVEQATSVYIDDVATLGDTDLGQKLFDIDRVEVLKGPQGTAFGKNTIGGVVSIHTLAPSFTPALKVSATAGSYGLAEFQGLVTGPLSDRVAAKLSAYVHHQDGNIHNPVTGADLGAERVWGVRGQVLANVTDNFTVRAGADYLKEDSDSKPVRFLSNGDLVASRSPFAIPAVAASRGQPPLSYPTFVVPNDPDTTLAPFNDRAPRRAFSAFIRADWDLDFATLTSITGYRYNKSSSAKDELGDPPVFLKLAFDSEGWQTTQELRLVSPADGKFTWLTGVYVALPHQKRTLTFPPTVGLGFLASGPQTGTAVADTKSLSGFAEVGYEFTDQLKLVLGGRYTHDRKTGVSAIVGSLNGGISNTPIVAHQKADWSAFTPKGTLEYTPTSDALLYATIARGYVGGGFLRAGPGVQPGPTVTLAQAIAANIAGLQTPFEPEYATNYEVGAKTSWLDHRLTANVSIYREDFKDLQSLVSGTGPGNVIFKQAGNAGRTRSQGLDLELHAVPAPWLRLGAIYSYIDAKYLTTDAAGTAGNYLPNAPTNSLNLSAGGNWDFDWGTLSAGGDITYRSKVFGDGLNNDAPEVLDKTRVKGLLNGLIDFKARDGRWDLRLWGRNLTDTRYGPPISLLLPVAQLFGYAGPYFAQMQWNAPRSFGATVTYHLR